MLDVKKEKEKKKQQRSSSYQCDCELLSPVSAYSLIFDNAIGVVRLTTIQTKSGLL